MYIEVHKITFPSIYRNCFIFNWMCCIVLSTLFNKLSNIIAAIVCSYIIMVKLSHITRNRWLGATARYVPYNGQNVGLLFVQQLTEDVCANLHCCLDCVNQHCCADCLIKMDFVTRTMVVVFVICILPHLLHHTSKAVFLMSLLDASAKDLQVAGPGPVHCHSPLPLSFSPCIVFNVVFCLRNHGA